MVQRETFQLEPYSRSKLNQSSLPMKKFSKDERGLFVPPNVDEQIKRIESALGQEWMLKLGVASETARTWRKRGAIPISRLADVAELSGRPIEWFKMNHYLPEDESLSFFDSEKKQISQFIGEVATLEGSKTDSEQAGELAMQRLQSSTQAIMRVSSLLEYEPPMVWTALIQELMFSHGLTEAGVRRIMETLRAERKST